MVFSAACWASGLILMAIGCDDVSIAINGRRSSRWIMAGRLVFVVAGAALWRLA